MKVRTRFAPSPTGHVHIGNIRVAIYNWLFARRHGGEFLLRVEDTDRERSTPEAIRALLDAMEWMGLDYDEEPLYQSNRLDAHLAAAEELLSRGLAYREDKGGLGRGECVVFRMPGEDISFTDAVKGPLTKPAGDLADFVIVRSDGTPVFHLANVLDDIHQGVTHVIRGDDHVENTFRHIALYRALGAEPPVFAHLPMIVNDRGKPYSKRDGDAFVGDFHEKGFLPEALFNYLVLLGWSPGDDREILSREELVEAFSLERCQSSPARFDLRKLIWMNGEYIRSLPAETFERLALEQLRAAGIEPGAEADLGAVFALLQPRVKTLAEIPALARCFFSDDFPLDEKAARKKLFRPQAAENLRRLRELLAAIEPFSAEAIDAAVHRFIEETGQGFGAVMAPLRLAVSGAPSGPDLFPMLAVLGRERVLRRIDRALERIAAETD